MEYKENDFAQMKKKKEQKWEREEQKGTQSIEFHSQRVIFCAR